MASGNEPFSIIGPTHLNSIDWSNAHHRRSVAASLVKGVYILEVDRQARRQGSQSLAPPWWKFFHFRLIHPLVDDKNCIFGAVFEKESPFDAYYRTNDRSPRYIIAFRGNLFKLDSFLGDIKSDIEIIRNRIHMIRRFEIAIKAVRELVADVDDSTNLWLTGHSLGAAMVMLAGKTMAKEGKILEAFLFNPPYVSPPIERIGNEKVRDGIRFIGTVIKAGLAISAYANGDHNQRKGNGHENSFSAISEWIPCLFVNPKDPICSEYKGYFEHRKKLEDFGARGIAKLTSQYSLTSRCLAALGIKGVQTSEPLHLLPSASLTLNLSRSQDAHSLSQWWRPNLNLKCNVYKYE